MSRQTGNVTVVSENIKDEASVTGTTSGPFSPHSLFRQQDSFPTETSQQSPIKEQQYDSDVDTSYINADSFAINNLTPLDEIYKKHKTQYTQTGGEVLDNGAEMLKTPRKFLEILQEKGFQLEMASTPMRRRGSAPLVERVEVVPVSVDVEDTWCDKDQEEEEAVVVSSTGSAQNEGMSVIVEDNLSQKPALSSSTSGPVQVSLNKQKKTIPKKPVVPVSPSVKTTSITQFLLQSMHTTVSPKSATGRERRGSVVSVDSIPSPKNPSEPIEYKNGIMSRRNSAQHLLRPTMLGVRTKARPKSGDIQLFKANVSSSSSSSSSGSGGGGGSSTSSSNGNSTISSIINSANNTINTGNIVNSRTNNDITSDNIINEGSVNVLLTTPYHESKDNTPLTEQPHTHDLKQNEQSQVDIAVDDHKNSAVQIVITPANVGVSPYKHSEISGNITERKPMDMTVNQTTTSKLEPTTASSNGNVNRVEKHDTSDTNISSNATNVNTKKKHIIKIKRKTIPPPSFSSSQHSTYINNMLQAVHLRSVKKHEEAADSPLGESMRNDSSKHVSTIQKRVVGSTHSSSHNSNIKVDNSININRKPKVKQPLPQPPAVRVQPIATLPCIPLMATLPDQPLSGHTAPTARLPRIALPLPPPPQPPASHSQQQLLQDVLTMTSSYVQTQAHLLSTLEKHSE